MRKILFSLLLAGTMLAAEVNVQLPESKLTVRVLDEDSRPITGATVTIAFENPVPKWGGGEEKPAIGLTDTRGIFSASGRSYDTLGGNVKKDGYYQSWWESYKFEKQELRKWKPWNPTTAVVLKRIGQPIGMYAKKVETDLPMADTPVGFDLTEGDWVAPHGRGKTSDFIFKLTKRVASFEDYGAELLLTFANQFDGIQSFAVEPKWTSALRSLRMAPEKRYNPNLSLLQGRSKEKGSYGWNNKNRNYFFRVRTTAGESGGIAIGLYGKIYGEIEYFPTSSNTAKLRFTYYLNPTPNDRNVEFDPKRNLFRNLKSEEEVTAP